MLMSASEALLSVPRAYTFGSENSNLTRGIPSSCILPYSISAVESVPRTGNLIPGRDQGRDIPPLDWTQHQSQTHASPFTSAPPEACAAFAAINDCAATSTSFTSPLAQDVSANSFSNLVGIPSGLSTMDSCSPYCLVGAGTSLSPACNPAQAGPPHGAKAECGKRTKMEDTYVVLTNFFPSSKTPTDAAPVSPTTATVTAAAAALAPPAPDGAAAGHSSCLVTPPDMGVSLSDPKAADMLHFFGVYDGHGGCEAAHHCAKRLHHHLFESLSKLDASWAPLLKTGTPIVCQGSVCHTAVRFPVDAVPDMPAGLSTIAAGPRQQEHVQSAPDSDMMVDRPSFNSTIGRCGGFRISQMGAETGAVAPAVLEAAPKEAEFPDARLVEALREAFLKTDAEFASLACASVVGSTAVVALLGANRIWIGNCGDSRAVLCRAGKAMQLTEDHKPERKDEAERVEKAGGHVLYWNGHRVMGILAMSRAIGDHGLRPYIIPEPEVSVVTRSADDEFLLLASDGLWDVMSNQEATDLASRCLTRAIGKGASRKAAVRISASVLTKAAIDRGSRDNVTVVMVDLAAKSPAAAVPDPSITAPTAKAEAAAPTDV